MIALLATLILEAPPECPAGSLADLAGPGEVRLVRVAQGFRALVRQGSGERVLEATDCASLLVAVRVSLEVAGLMEPPEALGPVVPGAQAAAPGSRIGAPLAAARRVTSAPPPNERDRKGLPAPAESPARDLQGPPNPAEDSIKDPQGPRVLALSPIEDPQDPPAPAESPIDDLRGPLAAAGSPTKDLQGPLAAAEGPAKDLQGPLAAAESPTKDLPDPPAPAESSDLQGAPVVVDANEPLDEPNTIALRLAAVIDYGSTPAATAGALLGLEWRPGPWSIGLEARGLLAGQADEGPGQVRARALGGSVVGCRTFDGPALCGTVTWGLQPVEGVGYSQNRSTTTAWAVAGLRARYDVEFGQHWPGIGGLLELGAPVAVTRLTIDGRSVWSTSPVLVMVGIGSFVAW